MRRHAGEFDIDPERIAAVGQASGGHLATLLATLPDEKGPDGVSSRVQVVVNFYGPSDLVGLMNFRHVAHEPARTFLGDPGGASDVKATQASPLQHVTASAPAHAIDPRRRRRVGARGPIGADGAGPR